ncbi:hypothetical protein [Chryseobacterium sp.]|uniref:hypothetical protein n=1 Tax=Chryseobacterium sp. TaxID=1871047 RepID=UPI0028A1A344|nr:hypothetical protein [Chryseobacterium sp.]
MEIKSNETNQLLVVKNQALQAYLDFCEVTKRLPDGRATELIISATRINDLYEAIELIEDQKSKYLEEMQEYEEQLTKENVSLLSKILKFFN